MLTMGRRAYGQRFRAPTNLKMRAINIVPDTTQSGASWSSMWAANYFSASYLHAAVDLCLATGANAVKVTMPIDAILAGGAAARTALDRYREFCDYTATKGALFYVNFETVPGTNSVSAIATASATIASHLDQYPHVVGIDLLNEPNGIGAYSGPNTGLFAQAVIPAVRAVTSIPLTISLAFNNPTQWATSDGGGYHSAIAGYVDFWDFHTYHVASDPAGTYPTVTDLASFRARTLYKPWMLGETGSPGITNTLFYGGSAEQSAWYTAMTPLSQEPDCLGLTAFCLTDYDAELFGMYPTVASAGRSQMTSVFPTWRGVS